jgi:hypothetical protein
MLEEVRTTVVYGYDADTIYVSSRARGTQIDLGEALRDAFDQIGSAGGHVDMAGAQIRLGVLEAVDEEDESLRQVVEEVVANRFLEAAGQGGTDTVEGVYDPERTQQYLESDAASVSERTDEEEETILYTDRDSASVTGDASAESDKTDSG